MIKIKNKIRTLINSVLTFLVGGSIYGCAVDYGPMPLYAPPAPEPGSYLLVEGKVVDESGRPLGNIRVDLKAPHLAGYVPKLYTDENGHFAYSENYTSDFKHDTLQVYFSDKYQIYAPDSLQVPFAEMKIDTIDTGIYGCTCNVDMQLTKMEQPAE